MRASHRLAVIRRTIPFLAAFVGLLALAAAVIVQFNADQRARDLGTQIADLKTTIAALTTRADALAKAQDDGTAEGLLALQDRMQKLEGEVKTDADNATRLAASDLRPAIPAASTPPPSAGLAVPPTQPLAGASVPPSETQVADADPAAPNAEDDAAVAAGFADAEDIAIREGGAGAADEPVAKAPDAQQPAAAKPAADAPPVAQVANADAAAASEAAAPSQMPAPAAPPALAYAPPEPQKPVKADPSLPTTDCIPLGTRFMATPNESYPLCQSKTVVKVGAILDGTVDIAGAGTLTQSGFGKIAGTDCTISVYTADPAGFADLRVTCG